MPAAGKTSDRGYGQKWKRLRLQAFALYGDTCHLCGQPGADTIDHLDPLAVVGRAQLPHIERLRPAHQACNSRRGARDLAPSPRSRVW